MADKKITKRENFTNIMEFLTENGKTEWASVIAHEIELLDKKSSKSASATPAQKDSALLMAIVKDILTECADEKGMAAGDILKDCRIDAFVTHDNKAVSAQKLTNVLTNMLAPDEKHPNATNELEREVIKKTAYFRIKTECVGE